jgi:hypothetical protein
MRVREFLPKDYKSVVRVLLILVVLKVIQGFVGSKLPASVQPYYPSL